MMADICGHHLWGFPSYFVVVSFKYHVVLSKSHVIHLSRIHVVDVSEGFCTGERHSFVMLYFCTPSQFRVLSIIYSLYLK